MPPKVRSAPTGEETGDAASVSLTSTKRTKAKDLKWADNPAWTRTTIAYLLDNPTFRIKLFSDSVRQAKAQNRRKVQGHDAKINLYGILAGAIFTDIGDEQLKADYADNPNRFAKSTQQQFQRLKKVYMDYQREILGTGSGIKLSEEEATSLIARIRSDWPFYDDLHSIWCELPNYNPLGVSNSEAGKDHSKNAEVLFKAVSEAAEDDAGTGSGMDDVEPEENIDVEEFTAVVPEAEDSVPKAPPPLSPTKRSPRLAEKAARMHKDQHDENTSISPPASPSPKSKALPQSGNTASAKSRTKVVQMLSKKGSAKTEAKAAPQKSAGKRKVSEVFGDVHTAELDEITLRREDRSKLRLQSLELKRRKLELDHVDREKERERQERQDQRQFDMMRMMVQHIAPSTFTSSPSSSSSSASSSSMSSSPSAPSTSYTPYPQDVNMDMLNVNWLPHNGATGPTQGLEFYDADESYGV
ncbi:hypothetical protein B0H21DRAFT_754970 [Amylocystis lapponica]|nr:hypothetical protein B0H21DRAFT_815220 [Amylocystis lapponica]KAH9940287.1 hypothetical protein B0H21DRAFT_754970 [Amylocystis lapponica]